MAWFFAFFILPRFCGLAYQIVLLRVTMVAFGVTTPIISIVFSVFMAGFAVGCWGTGCLVCLRGFEPLATRFAGKPKKGDRSRR